MDDPWANAWGETSRPALSESSASSWTAPSVSVIQGDHEDDLSMPSWSSGPNAGWTEPDLPETSLWGADTIAGGWNPAPSSFDRMSLASKESDANAVPDSPNEPLHSPADHEPRKSPETPPLDEGGWKVSVIHADTESPNPSPPASPVKAAPLSLSPANGVSDFGTGGWDPAPSLPAEHSDESLTLEKEPSSQAKARPVSSVPDDIDGFGVFETAHEADEADGWGDPSRAGFTAPSGDPWATAEPWGSESAAHTQEDTSEDDAWEAAKQQKAKQDLHVPPELLASILRQFEDLALDLWPDKEEGTELERRVDFESIGLESAVSRLIPQDLTLPQNVPFSKTFSSKQVAEALKLTRHSACTRSGPMAFYMASKGSSSWEAALKSKPLVPQEDTTPAGWKIVAPEEKDSVPTDETKKRPGGGLLSFFQRKSTASSVSEEAKQQEPAASSTGTPRVSVDSTKSSASQDKTAAKSTPSSPSVVSFASSLNPISEATVAKPPTPSLMPDFSADSIVRVETPPAPSAVSRFLGRFSGRTRTSSNPSMALSSDDLEFLADVPTAASGDTVTQLDTDSLSAMIRSPPLPTKLPAPLAPPPRAPPQPTRTLSPPPPPKTQPVQADDFMSFFDALPPTQVQAPSSSDSPLSLLAPSPPPPVKPDRAQSVTSFQAFAAPAPSVAPSIPETRGFSLDERAPTPKDESANTDSWPSFDYPVPAPSPKPPSFRVATPSQAAKRPFVAVMASSSRPPSAPATPPLLPKPGSGFAFPPPPSTQRPAINGSPLTSNSRGSSPFPPPPSSRGQTPLSIQPTPPPQPSVSVDDDDDDFADFLSSPAQTTPPASNAFQSFASAPAAVSTSPPPRPMHTTNLSDSFDDFMDPIPPIPPAKNAPSSGSFVSARPPALAPPPAMSIRKPPASSPPPPPPAPSSSSSSLSQKPSRKADHSRTLSLMETAAARGRWLGPPSPLPEALPPPTSNHSNNGHAAVVDYMGGALGGGDGGMSVGASSMQAAQAVATNAMSGMSGAALRPDSRPSLSRDGNATGKAPMTTPSWAFPPPAFNLSLAPPPRAPGPFPSGALKPANLNANGTSSPFTFPPMGTPAPSASVNASKGTGTAKTGGLSAQDLSFFEGL